MSDENTPEDLESTVRLNPRKIMEPYDKATTPAVDSIDDILSAEEFSSTSDISFEIPEEAIISTPESINFDDLTKEMNDLSNEFELNALEEEQVKENSNKKVAPATVIEDKPKEKEKNAKTVSHTDTKKAVAKESLPKITTPELNPHVATPTESKQDNKPNADIANKKEVKKIKLPTSTPKSQKTASNTNNPSNGIGVAMIFISLIALVAGVAGIWSSMSSQSQIDALSTQLKAIQSSPSDNQPELVAMQKQLTSLKQELASLKTKHETPAPITNEPSMTIQPVKKVAPVAITPITPIKEVKPTLRKNTWNVIISSHNSLKKAKIAQQNQLSKGMQTSIASVTVKGKNWYRIVATGFVDKQQAITFTHKLKKQGIADAWVQYNK